MFVDYVDIIETLVSVIADYEKSANHRTIGQSKFTSYQTPKQIEMDISKTKR